MYFDEIFNRLLITINPNSDSSGEFLVIHELTHAIGTNDMMNIVKNTLINNKEFQSLLKIYNKSEIDKESLADVSKQLFGIKSLSTDWHPGKKWYNSD